MNTTLLSPKGLKTAIHGGASIAVLDVREHGQYGGGHLFHASNCPYSRLEARIERLVPNRSTRCVLYDGGGGVAERSAARLRTIGYDAVDLLDGGVEAWAAAGYQLFEGVNAPSKTFGELVEGSCHPPVLTAGELYRWREEGRPYLGFDARPFSEFRKMSIPGTRCVPNGELLYRWRDLVDDTETPVVINCAGRTRGLIGAQTLLAAGVPNPVYFLENGTLGWVLADFKLDRGIESPPLPVPSQGAPNFGCPVKETMDDLSVDMETAIRWRDDAARSCYWLDVRTREEFESGHLAGSVHAPVGQLVQATDHWIAVRRARVVLLDDDGVRAATAAVWLRQMGHEAYALEAKPDPEDMVSGPDELALPGGLPDFRSTTICVEDARALLASGEAIALDVRSSRDFHARAIPGSRWTIRPRIGEVLRRLDKPVIVVADDAVVSALAAREAAEHAAAPVRVLEGGFDAWQAADFPLEPRPDDPPEHEAIDYLYFVHDRHDGNLEAARQYLSWELALVDQLDEQERAEFALRIGKKAP